MTGGHILCPPGFALVGIWDDDDRFSDLDRMKCQEVAPGATTINSQPIATIKGVAHLHNLHGGTLALNETWLAECPANQVVVSLADDNDDFQDLDDFRCATINSEDYNVAVKFR